MHADMFIVRHAESGAPYLIARHVAPHVHVVNAGDGRHAHPTQGLLDMYTIRHYKQDFNQLTVAVVGDIVHSRVARSDIHALTTLGAVSYTHLDVYKRQGVHSGQGGGVEADHFERALDGARLALRFLAEGSPAQATQALVAGFRAFERDHARFFGFAAGADAAAGGAA